MRRSLDQPGTLHAVGPGAGLQAALARQQAELARRQQQVAESQASINVMIAEHEDSRRATAHSDAEQLLGMDAVQDRLDQLARDTTEEILTFMPGGAQSPAALRSAQRNDSRLLEHGVSIRTIGATRLGVSPRTARRMMAELMERLGARSRFEAGLKAAQHGWL